MQTEASGLGAADVDDLYRRYGRSLERRARLLLRDPTLAEDAMQELVAVLLRRGAQVRVAESPFAWLCRTTDRVCLDLLRRTRRSRDALPLDDVDLVGPAPGVDPVLRRLVLASLEQLDEADRDLAIWVFVDGMSQGEAAGELGVSRVTVNKRVQRLKAALQSSLGSSASLEEMEES